MDIKAKEQSKQTTDLKEFDKLLNQLMTASQNLRVDFNSNPIFPTIEYLVDCMRKLQKIELILYVEHLDANMYAAGIPIPNKQESHNEPN